MHERGKALPFKIGGDMHERDKALPFKIGGDMHERDKALPFKIVSHLIVGCVLMACFCVAR